MLVGLRGVIGETTSRVGSSFSSCITGAQRPTRQRSYVDHFSRAEVAR